MREAHLMDQYPASWQPATASTTASTAPIQHISVAMSSGRSIINGTAPGPLAHTKVTIMSTEHPSTDAASTQPRSQASFSPCATSDLPLLIPIALVSTLATILTHVLVARVRARRPPLLLATCLLPAAGYLALYAAVPYACATLTLVASSLYAASALALTWTPHSVRGDAEKKAAAALMQVGAGVVGGLAGTVVYKMAWGVEGSAAHLWSVGALGVAVMSVLELWWMLGTEEGDEKGFKDVEM
jgi:hypothetical protein